MRGIAVCVLMLTLSLWTVQQGKALPWKKQITKSSSQFPQYRLLQKTPHFEYRSYEPSTLVSTGVPVNSSIDDLFDKLTNLQTLLGAGVTRVAMIRPIHGQRNGESCVPYHREVRYQCEVDSNTRKLYCYTNIKTRRDSYLTKKDCSYEGLGIKDHNGVPCYFPFEYNGVWYHACTTRDSDKLWCSHTGYYQRRWGYCPIVQMDPAEDEVEDLPELSVAYVLPVEMKAEASAAGNDVTVSALPAGNICTRDLETTDMTYEMVLATASELVKHCRQAGHNHARISLVKYLDKDEPRAEMWYM